MSPGHEHDSWVQRVLAVDMGAPGLAGARPNGTGAADAIARWKAALKASIAEVSKLSAALKGLRDPDADAINEIILGALRRLAQSAEGPPDVPHIEKFLNDSDEVRLIEADNQFGLKIRLREPLTAALEAHRGG